jgi:serine/threonine-protein kinase HipA
MRALRFKLSPEGEFMDNNKALATPPRTSIRELEYVSLQLEKEEQPDTPEYIQWLNILIAPGSSLGGARPKANILDESGHLWIAKFPSGYDTKDMGAWEFYAELGFE